VARSTSERLASGGRAVLVELVLDLAGRDAEDARGLGGAPAHGLEGLEDGVALEVGDGAAGDGGPGVAAVRAAGGGGDGGREVLDLDALAAGEDDAALDGVLELAHVAGPRVAHEAAAGPPR
jgi:hypothetical protein